MMKAATWDFQVVVDEIVKVVTSLRPPAQVLVGMDAKTFFGILRMLPQWVRNMFMIQVLQAPLVPAAMKNAGAAANPKDKDT